MALTGEGGKPINEMTVLITGGSGGIGGAIAGRFASVGMNIVIHYMNSHEAANDVARRCLAMGAKVMTVAADMKDRSQLLRMAERLESSGMLPDILVNNAGKAHYGMLADVTEEEWDEVMAVNLKGTFLCSQIFMPYMVSQRFGRIINVSSVWGISGASCEVAYSASKGGVNAFTKALAKELAPSGVTVNAVAPGAVNTAMLNNLQEEDLRMLEEEIPAGRLASPEEVASLVYFLALPESGYITGQVISPNGGWIT
ncbi:MULTISPECIES: 3-oxoacyl-ACP reductase FabG [unclassified Paenibacillus]|uniref:elongation factor P 5-aminopentanone reductase n=1 Tax=unclassified Paenibacillus TaxID=185978 RepID=UPI0024068963|nr:MULTISPECIES: 3-oxoacyl-ACP reductase FabG [unclassified Paenibacillus]MDF9841316.1 3-oxoacyl-[acyl-carrier protein] reductase [Paenibacillus sp. PastF-2]MDF9847907.1 3-oxoacyl-[acyl-carrier protein] reductase [Paenibacillus sp. PastM-2]MDF9854475.1 3-oxoacyl-[acyl-carrier protein] reductase [Paenibacillus sp. PastF-1]MDH6479916.1 3-oxoacyl-[acyl-carrier protein] reductase [Paenibacillus sp. PastH-2]MDH6507182.1 3-oxoacyl-[acyl-carrier protein] reductase [Paenibacillus sp. PastM-3]